MADQLVIVSKFSFRCSFGLPLLVKLPLDRVKVGFTPNLHDLGLLQKFADKDNLMGVVAGLSTKLILGMNVNYCAALYVFAEFLIEIVSLLKER